MTNEMIMVVIWSFLFLGTVISGILLSIKQHKNLTREEQYAKSRDEIARHMDIFGVSDAKEGSE